LARHAKSEGAPIAFDSIHACGCYYLLFPGQGYRAIAPEDDAEPVLSPMPIPEIPAGKRLLLRFATRTHYLRQFAIVPIHQITLRGSILAGI